MSQPEPIVLEIEDASSVQLEASWGFEVLDGFQRFNQRFDVFNRSHWDPRVRSEKTDRFFAAYARPVDEFRSVDGFTQRDYALRNAAWHVTDIFAEMHADADRREGYLDEYSNQRDPSSVQAHLGTPAQSSTEIKAVAKLFGADLVGITANDLRWIYTHRYSRQSQREKPNDLPDGLSHVIVIGQAMVGPLIDTSPSALSGTATGLGYSRDTLVLLGLTQYIRNLGYRAYASLNDSALAIPLAIQAGLGEYGRHGLLITREFGPRVRLGKIFTDLPLAHDQPSRFGVREFCEICRRCSNACPVRAIPDGEPSAQRLNESTIAGVRKWSVDGEKCFRFWANQNTECSICVRVCPYNRDYSRWLNRLWRRLAGTRLRRLLLAWSAKQKHGLRLSPKLWWARLGNGRPP